MPCDIREVSGSVYILEKAAQKVAVTLRTGVFILPSLFKLV